MLCFVHLTHGIIELVVVEVNDFLMNLYGINGGVRL